MSQINRKIKYKDKITCKMDTTMPDPSFSIFSPRKGEAADDELLNTQLAEALKEAEIH
jgi:hypothetical protein